MLIQLRRSSLMRKHPGERAGEHLVTVLAVPQGENDVILLQVQLPAGEGAERDFILDRLCDVKAGVLAHGARDFLPVHGAGAGEIRGQHRPDAIVRQILQHHFPLVQIAHPVGANGGQYRSLVQVIADDLRSEGQQAGVIHQLAAERVHEGDRAPAHTMHQPRNAQGGTLAEDERIERLVGHMVVDDVDPFQSAHRL